MHELIPLLRRGEITSRDIVDSIFQRISQVEHKLHSFVTLTEELAYEQAEEAGRRFSSGNNLSSLTGIPISIKDIICTQGLLTTCASKILSNFIPPYDGTVIKRLREAGAVFVGKTNMDEFGMGSSTETSYFGVTKNPWDLGRIPGGSSGGSAAAVASDECIASLGTDTGGSVRQPAALCGVVGLKPSYGRVSRFGLIAYASSLDQIGPITKDVMDCAILMKEIAGHDPLDSTSARIPVPDYCRSLAQGIKGMRIGVPKEYFVEGIDPDVERAVKDALRIFEKLGATCDEVSLPHTEYALAAYYIIAPAEASSNLARYDGVKYGYRTESAESLLDMYMKTRAEGFGTEVKRRIMLGTYALSAGYYEAYYKKAQQVRTLVKKDFDEAFEHFHVLVTPTSPTPAFRIGERLDDPLKMYLSDVYTIPINLAGITALSIPCGFSHEGLPIGLQIIGKQFQEDVVLRVAYAFEKDTDYHLRRPEL